MSPCDAPTLKLGRFHAKRLREVYRSAGWPCLDTVEVELIAAGLLERTTEPSGHDKVRVSARGIAHLAQCIQGNRHNRSAHELLVERVGQEMLRDGRVVWTGLSLRAGLPSADGQRLRWKMCRPDVFSIRNTTVASYVEPIVHEIKVSRADLLGDLKSEDKRKAYLEVGGQCWYVLGCDGRGRTIGQADEVPPECGVIIAEPDRLHVARNAAKTTARDLPFAIWMALAKSIPLNAGDAMTELQAAQGQLPEV
ncbi:MAG: hypothetical protein ACKVOT_00885 [Polaromonas sp.]